MTRAIPLLFLVATTGYAQPPDRQAEAALTAGQQAYEAGNLTAATEKFQEIVQKFGGTPSVNAARYGLALCLIHSPEQQIDRAIELLKPPADDGGFPQRGPAAYQLALCNRKLGIRELEKATTDEQRKKADPRFAEAARRFASARDWYAGKKDDDRVARCRCDIAEMELRQNRVKEARATCESFIKDRALAKNRHRPLGLYYHGFACFLDHDYRTASRSLNQLAPFTDPATGLHARYLVGRVLHLSGERIEASAHYDSVLADYAKAKTNATRQLTQPEKFKNDPFEKSRLETLANGPPPEYVAAAAFHGACLNFESGRYGEALSKFQAFSRDYASSSLQPDAALRVGYCEVQLGRFDDAQKRLAPLADKTPRLADQALFWLGKAQFGAALASDTADRDNRLKTAIETLRKAADKAGQIPNDPDSKVRRQEMRFELADAMQVAHQFREAAPIYEQLWNEQAFPARRDELLQRLGAAWGAAGETDRSNQRCDEFRRTFPQSLLLPAVLYRQAENAHTFSARPGISPEERQQRLEEAAAKFREVVDRHPEFERVHFARFSNGVCLAKLGKLEEAVAAFEAIPVRDRTGELAAVSCVLADCLIRQVPANSTDDHQKAISREKLMSAARSLEGFVAANPTSPEAAAALLKLGDCTRLLGSTLTDAAERTQALTHARAVYARLAQEHPKDPLAGRSRLEQAKVKALLGDRTGAMADLSQFARNDELRKAPEAPLAALYLANLYRDRDQPAEAAQGLDEARKRHEAELARDPSRAAWVSLLKYHHAVALFEAGKPTEAQPLFDQIAGEARTLPIGVDAALRSARCRVAVARKKQDDARKARAQAGTDQGKINAANQAQAHARNEMVQAADNLLRRADEFRGIQPHAEPRARMLYEAAWAFRGIVEERTDWTYRKLIEEFPDSPLAVQSRQELAEILADRGKHPEAVKLLREALDHAPPGRPLPQETIDRLHLELGAYLQAMKEYAAAAIQFEAVARDERSSNRPQAIDRAGESLLAAGEFAKAAERLAVFRDKKEFQTIEGVSDRALVRLGQALAATRDYERSRQAFEELLQRHASSPLAAEARYGIGWTFQQQGQFDAAIKVYQQVIEATTAEVAARAQLGVGQCRMAQRDYSAAAAAFLVVPFTYDYPELDCAAALEAARAFAANHQPEQADRVLRKLLANVSKDSEWARIAEDQLAEIKK